MRTLKYRFQAFLFKIIHRHCDRTFWFPSQFSLEITHIPTIEEFRASREPVFIRGELTFRHGILRRRSATLNVYKQFSIFMPQYWRWAGTGQLTPGFTVEDLERRWCERRQAMNVALQFNAKP